MHRIISVSSNRNLIFIKTEDEAPTGEVKSFTLAKEFAQGLTFSKDAEIDDETMADIKERAALTYAVMKALDALSYSNLSRFALVMKLMKKYKIKREHAEAAADYAVSNGYIDETAQAAREAELSVRTKGRGRRRIAADLAAKGYPREAIDEALDSVPPSEYYGALVSALRKKVKNKPRDREGFMKIAAAAARLGHSRSDIERAIEELFTEDI